MLLNKKQLEDAAKCNTREIECGICKAFGIAGGTIDCVSMSAQTALAYREMMVRLEWGAIANWGNDRRCMVCLGLMSVGHKPDCELAELLEVGE